VHMARDDDTNQMNGISIPDECAWCTRSIQVYIRLTHLVGEFTAYKCGAKPQRLLNEGASHTIECMCIAQSKERSYIRHTYLVKGKTLCIQFVYMLREGVFLCIRLI